MRRIFWWINRLQYWPRCALSHERGTGRTTWRRARQSHPGAPTMRGQLSSLPFDVWYNQLLCAWMRSSRVLRVSGFQCQSRNSPGFDHSFLRPSGIWGAADEAVLKNVHPPLIIACSINPHFFQLLMSIFFIIRDLMPGSVIQCWIWYVRHALAVCTYLVSILGLLKRLQILALLKFGRSVTS